MWFRYVQQQIEKAKAEAGSDEEFEATELLKDENEILKLDLKLKPTLLASDSKVGVKSVFKEAAAVKKESDKVKKEKEDSGKRKMSALEEIMEQGKKKMKEEEEKKPKVPAHLHYWYHKLCDSQLTIWHLCLTVTLVITGPILAEKRNCSEGGDQVTGRQVLQEEGLGQGGHR